VAEYPHASAGKSKEQILGMIRGIFSLKKIKSWVLNLKGIASGCYGYKGPDMVQLDCTDRCNSNCLACWTHSPLIKNNPAAELKDMEPARLKDFIREVKKSGAREICFSGGGEPFLYSHIWEILEFVQEAGLPFCVNTNFTLLNKQDIRRLLSYNKLKSLTVSIWAPEADLYSKLHGRKQEDFYTVRDNLEFLNREKPAGLKVILYAVVTNLNYFSLNGLMNLAEQTGCKAIEFAVIDVVPGATDTLLLNAEQLKRLADDFLALINKAGNSCGGVQIINKDLFLRRILCPEAAFGEYDAAAVQKPCYSGWVFLRLRANGDLNSCLKAHRIPIGNIYKDNFLSIWNNDAQKDFRRKSLSLPRDREFFRLIGNGNNGSIGCRRSCDNMLINEHIHKLARYLARP
jgi:MoaA/NifB/PqqE/SkfB family radical SAM enzyme